MTPIMLGKWHPAKIAVVWVIALVSYLFFRDVLDFTVSEARSGLFFAMAVAAIITWRWLTKREGGPGSGQNSD